MRVTSLLAALLLVACCSRARAVVESCSADLLASAPDAAGEEAYERLQELGQACAQPGAASVCVSHGAKVSDSADRLQRTFFSPAHKHAAALVARWMEDAGLRVWTDVVGNVRGRVEGTEACGGALVLGSHYDTVLDAGKFDGALGIVTAISAVKAFLRDLQALPRCPVEIVAFSDEEGVRFHSTFLGSRVFSGSLSPDVLRAQDGDGITVAQVLLSSGAASDGQLGDAIRGAAAAREGVRAYVEVHIEQGPVLEDLGVPLGVVTAIAGQTFLHVSMRGSQGHAGAVPMETRRDTLAAAADAVLAVERGCQADGVRFTSEEGLVCTVGQLSVWPGASNVIAGLVNFTVDLRSRQNAIRSVVVAETRAAIQEVCARRNISCTIEQKHEAAALGCSPTLQETLGAAVAAVNAQHAPPAPAPRLVSGAGHDGLALAGFCQVGMVFVRCRGGVSHSPLEFVAREDIWAAVAVLLHVLRNS